MKNWEVPTLVCLHKSTVEESVLSACRGEGYYGPDKPHCLNHQVTGVCAIFSNS